MFLDAKPGFLRYKHSQIDSRGSPYDFDSIMHYGWNDYAILAYKATIRSRKGESFGQTDHISDQDAAQINKYYKCKPRKKNH